MTSTAGHERTHDFATRGLRVRGASLLTQDINTVTSDSAALRAVVGAHRDTLDEILERHSATNPRLFGSVARGDASADSDLDLLVDLLPTLGTPCCAWQA